MTIAIEHRPSAGSRPFFLVANLRGRPVEDGGYETREDAEAAKPDFVCALRGAFA